MASTPDRYGFRQAVSELEHSTCSTLVIETFRHGAAAVYARFAERGRMLPPGLEYIDSWIDADHPTRCFPLMQTDDATTFTLWTSAWDDLVAFEIVPVIGLDDAAAHATTRAIPPEPRLPSEP